MRLISSKVSLLNIDAFRWNLEESEVTPDHSPAIRVNVLHSFYRSSLPSGENEAVLAQVKLLASAGFHVNLISLSSDDLEATKAGKYLAAVGLAVGKPTAVPPMEWFEDADVVHIHNTFPGMSHRWLSTLALPKVVSVHNYRAFCANALFLRDGKRCMDCTTHGVRQSVIHGCYRDSRLQTLPIALQQHSNNSLKEVIANCDQVLIPGEPMREVFTQLGIANTRVLPQPVQRFNMPEMSGDTDSPWLFVGRLSPEKGILDLLNIWPPAESLNVVGSGPEQDLARGIAQERNLRVNFMNALSNDSVLALMAQSCGLIFPSLALEGAPLVYGEAMQAGLPIVAAAGSTLASQIQLDKTGIVFSWDGGKSLLSALDSVKEQRSQLAERARGIYADRYTPEGWIAQITEIYRDVIASHASPS